ncbi:MAG: fatty acid desaturase [Myxococcota bacterium]
MRSSWFRISPAWFTGAKIVVMHLAALAAIVVCVVQGVSLFALLVAFALYAVRGLGISVAYHRLLAHRTFKTSRLTQFLLAFAGALAMQGGPIWWSALHRTHHRKTDTEEDPHSPMFGGFWHAHLGWTFDQKTYRRQYTFAKDLLRYPELRWLDRHPLLVASSPIPVLIAVGLLFGELLGTTWWELVLWGQAISIVVVWHGTWCVNSVCHLWGTTSELESRDSSKNNLWVALVTFGEGWHNNHHRNPTSARLGVRVAEVDLGWWLIRMLEYFGLVWDVREIYEPRSKSMVTTEFREPSVTGNHRF